MASAPEVTRLLTAWRAGNDEAFEQLFALVYAELHGLAHARMRGQPPDPTLQTTAVVHEAYLRLLNEQQMPWHNRAQFFAVCAQAMRCIIVDAARARRSLKRGAGLAPVPFDESRIVAPGLDVDVLALDEALEQLASSDARKAKVVELRYFGGLTNREAADVLDVSPETVMRDWKMAKLWLLRTLRHLPCPGAASDPS